jgi:hypothetical protein
MPKEPLRFYVSQGAFDLFIAIGRVSGGFWSRYDTCTYEYSYGRDYVKPLLCYILDKVMKRCITDGSSLNFGRETMRQHLHLKNVPVGVVFTFVENERRGYFRRTGAERPEGLLWVQEMVRDNRRWLVTDIYSAISGDTEVVLVEQ